MIPHVNTAEDSHAADAVKFPTSSGDRGLDVVWTRINMVEVECVHNGSQPETFRRPDRTLEAVQNIEEIAAVPGIYGVFVGPGDLGLRLKLQNGPMTMEFASRSSGAVCRKNGVSDGELPQELLKS